MAKKKHKKLGYFTILMDEKRTSFSGYLNIIAENDFYFYLDREVLEFPPLIRKFNVMKRMYCDGQYIIYFYPEQEKEAIKAFQNSFFEDARQSLITAYAINAQRIQ